ncbi:hypothetical protein ACLOJK_023834 [Asimina triloba]
MVLPWMDLPPKSDSPNELARAGAREGGKTERRECREADAGWSWSRRMREDMETRVQGGERRPEPEPKKEGSRRRRGCREGDAGRSGSRRRREERETGPPGGRRWMEPEPKKEGRQ